MIKKIGFVHTGVAIADMFKLLIQEHIPGVDTFHIVDDSLIQDLLKQGEFTPSILKRLCSQVALAEEADADLIMVTCSSIAPGVDVAKRMVSVPVLKVDEPMAEKAVALSDKIAVMATAKTTVGPSTKLVQDKADEAGKSIAITKSLSPDAFDCFLKGDMKTHDEILRKAGEELVGKVGVVILAQASMGHLKTELEQIIGVPVLTSPPEAMEALKKIINE